MDTIKAPNLNWHPRGRVLPSPLYLNYTRNINKLLHDEFLSLQATTHVKRCSPEKFRVTGSVAFECSRGRGRGQDAAPANAAATQPSSASATAAGSNGRGGRAAKAHAQSASATLAVGGGAPSAAAADALRPGPPRKKRSQPQSTGIEDSSVSESEPSDSSDEPFHPTAEQDENMAEVDGVGEAGEEDELPPPISDGMVRAEWDWHLKSFRDFMYWACVDGAPAVLHMVLVTKYLKPGRRDRYSHDAWLHSEREW
eukprot:5893608-Pleurochrysis_carterae.AAC.1